MTIKASKNKITSIVLTILLILLVTICLVLTSGFSRSNIKTNTKMIIDQGLQQSVLPVTIKGINETNSLNVTNSYHNYTSAPLNTDPVPLDTLNFTTYSHPDMSGFFFSPSYNTDQTQIAESDTNNNSYAPPTSVSISLDASNFVTYTYGGYPVQQPNSTQFIFPFPDYISQGQIAGSDALAWNYYSIQKMDFDAAFIAPKISALGFDEMAIFATSNTSTYKGAEFGIRMDLKDGFVYAYVQEPNGSYGDVNFKMQELIPNDGIIHHYTLIILSTGVSFSIDGIEYGYLIFPSNTDYSNLGFSICAVVHRFSDGWDSDGDNMITGNFFINQQ
jgi:hypothetical protein